MAATHQTPFPGIPEYTTPVLHRVYYTREAAGPPWFRDAYLWCHENCKHYFYHSPAWTKSFIEFEDPDDAVLFALHWS